MGIGDSTCDSGSPHVDGYGCGFGCYTQKPAHGRTFGSRCCQYTNPLAGQFGQKNTQLFCFATRLRPKTINPFAPPGGPDDFVALDIPAGESPLPASFQPTTEEQHEKENDMGHPTCSPGCDCNVTPGGQDFIPTGSGAPRNIPLCWAAAGNETVALAAGATATISVTIANYVKMRPRKLTISARDDTAALGAREAVGQIRVLSVSALGRNILGSAAGISGSSIAAVNDNALMFGGSIPAIDNGNTIDIVVRNDDAALALDVQVDVEGAAIQ